MKRLNMVLAMGCIVIVVMGVMPVTAAPVEPGWDVNVMPTIIFIGDNITGNVSGPAGAVFNLVLICTNASLDNSTHNLYFGQLDANGSARFDKRLDADFIGLTGDYYLNVTTNDHTVATCKVSLLYDKMKLLELRVEMQNNDIARLTQIAVDNSNNIFVLQQKTKKHDTILWMLTAAVMMLWIAYFPNYYATMRAHFAKRGTVEPHEAHDQQGCNDIVPAPLDPQLMPVLLTKDKALAALVKRGIDPKEAAHFVDEAQIEG
jgi:hypothetical protein